MRGHIVGWFLSGADSPFWPSPSAGPGNFAPTSCGVASSQHQQLVLHAQYPRHLQQAIRRHRYRQRFPPAAICRASTPRKQTPVDEQLIDGSPEHLDLSASAAPKPSGPQPLYLQLLYARHGGVYRYGFLRYDISAADPSHTRKTGQRMTIRYRSKQRSKGDRPAVQNGAPNTP